MATEFFSHCPAEAVGSPPALAVEAAAVLRTNTSIRRSAADRGVRAFSTSSCSHAMAYVSTATPVSCLVVTGKKKCEAPAPEGS